MRDKKLNFTIYSSPPRYSDLSRSTNISDLIKKNKEEEKREKIQKIYTVLGITGLIIIFGIFIYL